jgi:hypothetical protein
MQMSHDSRVKIRSPNSEVRKKAETRISVRGPVMTVGGIYRHPGPGPIPRQMRSFRISAFKFLSDLGSQISDLGSRISDLPPIFRPRISEVPFPPYISPGLSPASSGIQSVHNPHSRNHPKMPVMRQHDRIDAHRATGNDNVCQRQDVPLAVKSPHQTFHFLP